MDAGNTTITIVCPHCSGHAALDAADYPDWVGSPIDCPHCNQAYPVPELEPAAALAPADRIDRQDPEAVATLTDALETPAELPLQLPTPGLRPRTIPTDGARHCPRCQDEVGPRDRVCIMCSATLPL